MYLEISARNSGKTYRLQKAVREYISANSSNIANIIVLNEKSLAAYDEDLRKSKQVRFTTPEHKNYAVRGYTNVRNFYDDFDAMSLSFKKDGGLFYSTSMDDYYVTTPAKIRNVRGLINLNQITEDNLMALLLKNNRMSVSYLTRLAPDWISSLKDKLPQKTFSMEFEGKFLEY